MKLRHRQTSRVTAACEGRFINKIIAYCNWGEHSCTCCITHGPPVPLTLPLPFPSVCVRMQMNSLPPPPPLHVPNPASNLFHFHIPHCSKWHFYILWWTNYSVLHSPLALRANLPRSAGEGFGGLLLGSLDRGKEKKLKTRGRKKKPKKLMVPISDKSAGTDGGAGHWEVSKGDDGGRWRGHKARMRGCCCTVERSVWKSEHRQRRI